ncbi:hypothetical protein HG531_006600 [Fusarium graminearum]|nr:hypothetical protein HG531_006600 [Fusarium graminearum]
MTSKIPMLRREHISWASLVCVRLYGTLASKIGRNCARTVVKAVKKRRGSRIRSATNTPETGLVAGVIKTDRVVPEDNNNTKRGIDKAYTKVLALHEFLHVLGQGAKGIDKVIVTDEAKKTDQKHKKCESVPEAQSHKGLWSSMACLWAIGHTFSIWRIGVCSCDGTIDIPDDNNAVFVSSVLVAEPTHGEPLLGDRSLKIFPITRSHRSNLWVSSNKSCRVDCTPWVCIHTGAPMTTDNAERESQKNGEGTQETNKGICGIIRDTKLKSTAVNGPLATAASQSCQEGKRLVVEKELERENYALPTIKAQKQSLTTQCATLSGSVWTIVTGGGASTIVLTVASTWLVRYFVTGGFAIFPSESRVRTEYSVVVPTEAYTIGGPVRVVSLTVVRTTPLSITVMLVFVCAGSVTVTGTSWNGFDQCACDLPSLGDGFGNGCYFKRAWFCYHCREEFFNESSRQSTAFTIVGIRGIVRGLRLRSTRFLRARIGCCLGFCFSGVRYFWRSSFTDDALSFHKEEIVICDLE